MPKINLIYPPITRPRVPIGIAALKAYVEANSDARVKCFDLNADCYDRAIDAMQRGTINMGNSHDLVLEAIDFLRSGDIPEFYDREIYNHYIAVWVAFVARAMPRMGEAFFDAVLARQAAAVMGNDPDIVGFSCIFESQIDHAIKLAQIIKAINPNVQTVFGGSSVPDDPWGNPAVDHIIRGEGEAGLLALVSNHIGPYDLDDMPYPDFSDFDLGSYFTPNPFVPIMSSRGCPWRRCAFCEHHKIYGEGYRAASAKRVVDEMEYRVNSGVRFFGFVDEMVLPGQLLRIAREIQNRGLDVRYYLMARATARFSREALREAAKSGCQYIMWGLESGCQRVLDLMEKGVTVEGAEGTMRAAAEAGIRNHVFVIAGFPSESEDEFRETIGFLIRNRDIINMVHKSIFGLYRGTKIYRDPAKYHITEIYERPYLLGYNVSQGTKQLEVRDMLKHYYNAVLGPMCRISPASGMMREHVLMQYSKGMTGIIKPIPRIEDIGYVKTGKGL